MRTALVERVRETLRKGGFLVSEGTHPSLAYDVVARKGDLLVVLKVLTNVDGFSEEVSEELLTFSSAVGGVPLLVGVRCSSKELLDLVVYSRHGVLLVTAGTLEGMLLRGELPVALASPGGLCVRIDGEALRRIREERGLSLGDLAEAAGVSRRAILMYESGMAAFVEVAERLEEFLGEPLVVPFDPLSNRTPPPQRETSRALSGFQREALRLLEKVGFDVFPLGRFPFDAVAVGERTFLAAVEKSVESAQGRAPLLEEVGRVSQARPVVVVLRRRSYLNVGGLAVVERSELASLRDPRELSVLIEERSEIP